MRLRENGNEYVEHSDQEQTILIQPKVKRKRLRRAETERPTIIPMLWNCVYCTFENDGGSVCTMCYHPRGTLKPATATRANSTPSETLLFAEEGDEVQSNPLPNLQDATISIDYSRQPRTCAVKEQVDTTIPDVQVLQQTTAPSNEEEEDPVENVEEVDNETLTLPNSDLWIEKHSPIHPVDLHLHPKKKTQVETWIHDAISNPKGQILFLCGPSGSGKSTLVHTIAQKLNIHLREWTDPVANISFERPDSGQFRKRPRAPEDYISQLEDFGYFIQRSTCYSSLISRVARELILIEEWPAVHLQDQTRMRRFHQLLTPLSRTSFPVIILYNKGQAKVTPAYLSRIFSPALVESRSCQIIHCNPVAKGLIKKCLEQTALSEGMTLSSSDLQMIVEISGGDIRNALNTLHYFSNSHSANLATPKDNTMAKDVVPSEFHLIGKLLYGKEGSEPLEASGMDPRRTVAYLHHNCVGFYSDIENLADALESFSFLDQLPVDRQSWKVEKTSTSIVYEIAGKLVSVTNIATSPSNTFRPITSPPEWTMSRCQETQEKYIKNDWIQDITSTKEYVGMATSRSLILDYAPYRRQIQSKAGNFGQLVVQNPNTNKITLSVHETASNKLEEEMTEDEIESEDDKS